MALPEQLPRSIPGRDDWTVVLPVKSLSIAKSRIDPQPGGIAGALALAFFQDTLSAVVGCERVSQVLVATRDAVIADIAVTSGCKAIDDTGHDGINPAAAWAAAQRQGSGPVAVLVSDLPCLTSAALSAVLASAVDGATAFVADAEGTGTTMWMAGAGTLVEPRFGPASALAHRATGSHDLVLLGSSEAARRDVDTEADLLDAVRIGVGSHTRAALDAIAAGGRLVVTALSAAVDGRVAVADEDGRRRSLAWTDLADAGLRDIRAGQRLVIEDATSRVLGLP